MLFFTDKLQDINLIRNKSNYLVYSIEENFVQDFTNKINGSDLYPKFIYEGEYSLNTKKYRYQITKKCVSLLITIFECEKNLNRDKKNTNIVIYVPNNIINKINIIENIKLYLNMKWGIVVNNFTLDVSIKDQSAPVVPLNLAKDFINDVIKLKNNANIKITKGIFKSEL